MKSEKLYELLADIDEKHIELARIYRSRTRHHFMKWVGTAAGFVIVLMAVISVPAVINDNDTPIPPSHTEGEYTSDTPMPTTLANGEFKYEKGYFYRVDEEAFSAYVGGSVIAPEKIGNKLAEVSVTAGWKNENNQWISTEKLRGAVYEIDGISADTAAALKFIDKGEAVTTTHYYVIVNPVADTAPVAEYIIKPETPYISGKEMGNAVPE